MLPQGQVCAEAGYRLAMQYAYFLGKSHCLRLRQKHPWLDGARSTNAKELAR